MTIYRSMCDFLKRYLPGAERAAEQDRLPFRLRQFGVGEEPADPLGREVGIGRAEVEVEPDGSGKILRAGNAPRVNFEVGF